MSDHSAVAKYVHILDLRARSCYTDDGFLAVGIWWSEGTDREMPPPECRITIDEVTGLTPESSPGQIQDFRVIGHVVGGCKHVDVTIEFEGHTLTSQPGAQEGDVASDSGTWQRFVHNPYSLQCGKQVTVRATCTDDPSCHSDPWLHEVPCENVTTCPQIRDIVITGVTCAEVASGHKTRATIEVRLVAPVTNCTYIWLYGDEGSPRPLMADRDHTSSPIQTHDYDQPGLYSVTVTVRHSGCEDTPDSAPLNVPPCCPKLTALQADQECTDDGKTSVTFLVTIYPADAQGTYTWKFGDEPPGQPGQTTTLPTKNHVYAAGGDYPVKITFTPADSSLCPGTEIKWEETVRVQDCEPPPCPEIADVQLTNQVCVANPDGSADGAVFATYLVTTNPGNAAGRYDWQFDDGPTEQNRGPSNTHTYSGGGNKRVTVTLTPRETRCPPKSLVKFFDLTNCKRQKVEPPDPSCVALMIWMLMFMIVGAVLLAVGLCALLSCPSCGYASVGFAIVAVVGAVCLFIGLVLFVIFLLLCATFENNCWLLDLLIEFLRWLTILAVAVTAILFVIGRIWASLGLCWVGAGVDSAYFFILFNIAQWFSWVVGCHDWPRVIPDWMRVTLPGWLRELIANIRSHLP